MKDKLKFNIGQYVRRWGIEFVLTEVVDYMEGMDLSEPRFATLVKEMRASLVKFRK